MDAARISALLEPFLDLPLTPVQLDQISMYIDLLLRWNARINLTAVRDPESIVTRHFGESLFLARHAFSLVAELPMKSAIHPEANGVDTLADTYETPAAKRRKITAHGASRGSAAQAEDRAPLGAKEASAGPARPSHVLDPGTQRARVWRIRVVDIGSGAGFPALPMKIWSPNIALTMIESNHKKATFLREVSRTLTLTDVNVIAERAETLVDRLPPADLVTLRAVEHFENVVPIATRFLAPTGRLAFLIGTSQLKSLTALTPAISWIPPIPIPTSSSRVVAISESST